MSSSCPQETNASPIGAALHTHAADLRRFVAGRVAPADVEDVLQTAAVRAMERAHTLKDPKRVRAWLYQIHRNVIVDFQRKAASFGRLLEAQPACDEVPPPPSDICSCSLALAKELNPSYASVLSLVDLDGASRREAATILGITVNNATVRLQRARKALREAMLVHCGVQSVGDCFDCRCVADGCAQAL